MNDAEREAATANRKFYRRICIVVIGLVSLLLVYWISFPRLQPDEIVDQFGIYRLPRDGRMLKITQDDDGNVVVSVFGGFSSKVLTTFESERGWFLCVDRFQRLWIYHGHWDRDWGALRKMPSGGTVPYAPAVYLEGLTFFRPGRLAGGSQVVTHTGNWEGVPQSFLDRIPDRESAQWGNTPPVPTKSPHFTRSQELEIGKRLRFSAGW